MSVLVSRVLRRLVPSVLALSCVALVAPRTAVAACAHPRGDVAPGTLDTGTNPPTWHAVGNGVVDVGDVIVALRATVHLQDLAWDVPDPTCPTPADVAPGRLDVSGLPAHWFPTGDDRVDIGDVIALLRLSVGLSVIEEPLTYYRDTKAIIDDRCVRCHVTGGIGPFPLTKWEEVQPAVPAIQLAVAEGEMPPWPPDEACAQYEGSRALTPAQRTTMLTWIDQGALRGNPFDEPPPPPPPPDITYDISLRLPVPYRPDGSLTDDYRCFVVDWPQATTTYVNAVNVIPDVGPMVHHVIAYIADPAMVPTAEANDANDPGPGYTCFGGPGGNMRWLAGWAPGDSGGEFPTGTGIRIGPGSKLVIQVHYNMDNVPPEPDQSTIKVRTVSTVTRAAGIALFPATGFLLPAGDPDVTYAQSAAASLLAQQVRGEIGGAMTDPFVIHDVGHHMHQLGSWGTISLLRQSGANTCLLDIPLWDFHWQGAYRLTPSVLVQPADRANLTCNWDNSADNQPWVGGMQQSPVDVSWGEGSRDEMCLGIFYITAP